jgi:hypothetical protein
LERDYLKLFFSVNNCVQVLLDNKKIKNISFTDGEMNSIGYESLNEVFFDVFEIHSNGIELLKEKKGDFNGNPIIELDLNLENQIYRNVRFVLGKHDGVRINTKLLDHSNVMQYEETSKKVSQPKKKLITENVKPKPIHKSKPIISNPIIQEKNLIKESKQEFYNSIRQELIEEIKKEVRHGIISDLMKSNIKDNFDSFLKEDSNQSELSTLFREENEKFRKELLDVTQKIARREGMRFAESGGGTNAVQYSNGGTMNGDLIVNGSLSAVDLHAQNFRVDDLSVDQHLIVKSLSAENEVVTQNLNIIGLLSAANAEIGNSLFVDRLSSNYANINNDLTVSGGVSSYNGSYILGDVVVTGNLRVSQEIFGDLVSGNTIVNSSGDTLLAKSIKTLRGSDFVDGNYTVIHNLNSYDLLLSLYYVNDNGTREIVHASMINDSLSTTQISFGTQPPNNDEYKLIIMS